MSLLRACSYDWFVDSMERSCLRALRSELLANLHGQVLELGAGTGSNLDHYPNSIETLTLVEPDRYMRRRLQRKLVGHRLASRCIVLDGLVGVSSSKAVHFDAVVATLVLCSVQQVPRVLDQIRSVLHHGGRLLSIEHVAAPRGSARRRVQSWVEPTWKYLAGGCHLQRDPREFLAAAGFAEESSCEFEFRGVPGFMKLGLVSTWLAV